MNSITNTSQPQKRRWRWLKWGGLALIVLILSIAVGSWLIFQYQRRQWTDDTPITIEQTVDTAARQPDGKKLYRETRQALERGTAKQFSFDSRELNALLTQVPQFQAMEKQMALQLDGDKLLAKMSLPLDDIPGFQGRYLNGDFVFDLHIEQGVPTISLLSGTIRNQPIPEGYLQQLNRIGQKQLLQRLSAQGDLSQVESLRIENSRLILDVRGSNK